VIPQSAARPLATVLSALAMALALLVLPSALYAQSGDDYDRALTGDPLVDSILQAPGPDFIRGERGRAPQDSWRRDRRSYEPPRSDDRDDWEREPRRTQDDDWSDQDTPPRSTRDEEADTDPVPERSVRRNPPPPPVQRGDGPSDIIILDAEPSDLTATAQAQTGMSDPDAASAEERDTEERDLAQAQPEGDDVAEPERRPEDIEDLLSEADRTAARDDAPSPALQAPSPAQEEPYREAPARGTPPETPAPSERRIASVPRDTVTRAPAVPVKAPVREGLAPPLNKMIGQMLLIGFAGQTTSAPGVQQAAKDIRAGKAGGVIFMSRNIESPQQVKSLTRLFTEAAQGQSTPFIAVDQEGGYVQRLARTKGFKTHPSAERLGARNDPRGAYSAYRSLALELRDHGFNLNLGPVLDLNINPANPIIGRLKRSYGTGADHVASFAKAFVYAHNESGVLTAAKHFPGHGSSQTDSHDELVDISKSWSEAELRPYRKLIEADAIDMIMTGHLYHPGFSDRPGAPVSLSKKGIRTVLRESLNFDGVVISDDLDMRGVRENRSFEEAVISAAAAGNDILLITNSDGYKPDLADRVAAAIRAGIDDGRISADHIRDSYERVLKLKDELAQLQRTATGPGQNRGLPDQSGG